MNLSWRRHTHSAMAESMGPVVWDCQPGRLAVSARRKNCSFGGGFRQDSDLLREGDEAGVVLVGAQERIIKQLSHTRFIAFAQKIGVLPKRSEEHTSELQSLTNIVCRLLLDKKKHH